jgi:N-acetylglucosamine-6-phosphate deacetylase
MRTQGFDSVTGSWLDLAGGRELTAVDEQIVRPDSGPWLAPGFVDIQVNGYSGADYNDPACTLEAIGRSLEAQFSAGVTRLFPTVITGPESRITGALRNLLRARRELPHGDAMEAFHVEGPHISPADGPRGAHPLEHVRPPCTEEFLRWQDAAEGLVRLVTLSPEWPGAPAYIEFLVRQGVVAAIGHLEATAQQIDAAVSAGATLSTHLGNGAHSVLPRHPNYLWHQMAEDRLAASFICDGIHLDRAFLQTALRAKGVERSILITDAVMPAGCQPGDYTLGEVAVKLHPQGMVTLRESGRLAGSALRLDRGIDVLMRLGGLSLRDALTTATRNPARVGRVAGRQRGLAAGERADVVEFDFDSASRSISIRRTWLAGQLVFERAV